MSVYGYSSEGEFDRAAAAVRRVEAWAGSDEPPGRRRWPTETGVFVKVTGAATDGLYPGVLTVRGESAWADLDVTVKAVAADGSALAETRYIGQLVGATAAGDPLAVVAASAGDGYPIVARVMSGPDGSNLYEVRLQDRDTLTNLPTNHDGPNLSNVVAAGEVALGDLVEVWPIGDGFFWAHRVEPAEAPPTPAVAVVSSSTGSPRDHTVQPRQVDGSGAVTDDGDPRADVFGYSGQTFPTGTPLYILPTAGPGWFGFPVGPASATLPGYVTTGAQTIAGAKTFTSDVTAAACNIGATLVGSDGGIITAGYRLYAGGAGSRIPSGEPGIESAGGVYMVGGLSVYGTDGTFRAGITAPDASTDGQITLKSAADTVTLTANGGRIYFDSGSGAGVTVGHDGSFNVQTGGLPGGGTTYAGVSGTLQDGSKFRGGILYEVGTGHTISSGDVTTALGYTPYNSSNPASYVTAASPALTGTPTAPTPPPASNDTTLSTTAFVTAAVAAAVSPLAPLASPTLTGTPTAPTATGGTNTTQIATTAFVHGEVAGRLAAASNLSDLASPSAARTNLGLSAVAASGAYSDLTGTPTVGTAGALASDADTTLAANSDSRLATQKAVKTYVDASVAGLLDLKGGTDLSANPNYPAASKGDAYYCSVAGKVGGGSGKSLDAGDVYVAAADNAGGTEASVGSSWFVLEHNLVGALVAASNLSDLTNAATARTNLGLATVAASGAYSDLSGTPSLAAVATSGSASDLSAGTLPAARIASNSLAAAKLAASATDVIFGRSTAGAGAGEEIACTAAARSLLDDTTAAAMRTTLGLATVAATGSAADLSGTLAAARIASNSLAIDKIAAAATGKLFGRGTAGAGAGEEIGVGSDLAIATGTLNLATGTNCGQLNTVSGIGYVRRTGSIAFDVVSAAAQADQEAGTDTAKPVTPSVQHYHPSAAKAWVYFTVSGGTVTVQRSYNVTSVTRTGAGVYTVTWTVGNSDTKSAVVVTPDNLSGTGNLTGCPTTRNTGSVAIAITLGSGTLTDPSGCSVVLFGDL